MTRLCKDEEEGRVRGELGLAIAEEENGYVISMVVKTSVSVDNHM